jgi:alpha-1,2-mannosyltransferase
VVKRAAALLTPRRMAVWGTGLFVLTWLIYVHTMMVPGLTDRAGRFKGTDYIFFYVFGSLAGDGRMEVLYDPDVHLAEGRRRIQTDLALYAGHPNYGPQIALAFAPLARLPYGWSLAVFLALTATAYALSVWMLWRECPALARHGRLVALLAAASPAFVTLFRYAQLSALSLLLWSLAFVAMRSNRRFSAGLAIGCLAYKPQLGIVIGIVLLAAREWRVVAGAATTVLGQLALAWLVAGSAAMAAYFRSLWTLMLNPGLVQIHPSEVHSVRGFLQLLIPSSAAVTTCFVAALVVLLVLAVRSWSSPAPPALRWGQVVLLTVLASPHLMTYDLVLLTVPLLVFADWVLRDPDHPRRPEISLLLVFVYLAPFSSILARYARVQISVVLMAMLAWRVYVVCASARTPVASGFSRTKAGSEDPALHQHN